MDIDGWQVAAVVTALGYLVAAWLHVGERLVAPTGVANAQLLVLAVVFCLAVAATLLGQPENGIVNRSGPFALVVGAIVTVTLAVDAVAGALLGRPLAFGATGVEALAAIPGSALPLALVAFVGAFVGFACPTPTP